MNNEDMSDIIQKLSGMINNANNEDTSNDDISSNSKETNFNIQDILNNINSNSQNNEDNNNFNFDFNTIMKMKNIMDNLNSTRNSPEANLLLALKPYLNNNRKQKLDQYIQFLSIKKVLETLNTQNNKGE